MKIALCFRFSQLFDFALLRQGQFLQRIGKVERFKKELDSIKACLYIQNSTNFDILDLLGISSLRP